MNFFIDFLQFFLGDFEGIGVSLIAAARLLNPNFLKVTYKKSYLRTLKILTHNALLKVAS